MYQGNQERSASHWTGGGDCVAAWVCTPLSLRSLASITVLSNHASPKNRALWSHFFFFFFFFCTNCGCAIVDVSWCHGLA